MARSIAHILVATDGLTAEERTRFGVTIQVRAGSVADDILDFAREHNVDLIVMGTHGRQGCRICCSGASQSTCCAGLRAQC